MADKEISVPVKTIAKYCFGPHLEQLYKGLNSIPRWWKENQVSETLQQWYQLVGPDACSLTHPTLAVQEVKQFIKYSQDHGPELIQEEQVLLKTGAQVHDLGELIIDGKGVGDVPRHKKTQADAVQEQEVFELVMKQVPVGPDKDLIIRAYYQVTTDKPTKLGKIFNAIETIGYLRTAIRIYQGIDNQKITNWRWVPVHVLMNRTELLIKYAQEYPYISHVLSENQISITQIFSDMNKLITSGKLEQQAQTLYAQNLIQEGILTPERFFSVHHAWLCYIDSQLE